MGKRLTGLSRHYLTGLLAVVRCDGEELPIDLVRSGIGPPVEFDVDRVAVIGGPPKKSGGVVKHDGNGMPRRWTVRL